MAQKQIPITPDQLEIAWRLASARSAQSNRSIYELLTEAAYEVVGLEEAVRRQKTVGTGPEGEHLRLCNDGSGGYSLEVSPRR